MKIMDEARRLAADPDWYPPPWIMHTVAFVNHPVRYTRYFIKGVRWSWRRRQQYVIRDPWQVQVSELGALVFVCTWVGHDRPKKMHGLGACNRCGR